MSENDPLAGLTLDKSGTLWVGRTWFTPKHEIRVVFDQWVEEPDDLNADRERARAIYALMRQREWEYRLTAAQDLVEGDYWSGQTPPEPEELARRMLLVEVVLFGDGSGHLKYHGPAVFEKVEIVVGLWHDGEYDDVTLEQKDES